MKRALAILAAAIPTMAVAQSTDTDLAQETAALNAQAARDNAAAAAVNAQSAKIKAQTDALGIPKIDGKVTTGTNAGVMESWMLSSYVVDAAGQTIATNVTAALRDWQPSQPTEGIDLGDLADRFQLAGNGPDGNLAQPIDAVPDGVNTVSGDVLGSSGALDAAGATPEHANGDAPTVQTPQGSPSKPRVLLVSGDDALALDNAANVSAQISLLDRKLTRAAVAVCPRPAGHTEYALALGPALPVIGAVANLLKTDTDVSGIDVTVPNRMLVSSTGKHLRAGATVVLPAAAVATSRGSPTAKNWSKLLSKRELAKGCLPSTPDDKLKPPLKDKVKALKEAIAAVVDAEGKLLKQDDKGNTPLGQAVRVDALLIDHPYVLRVNVEKGGGTLLKRANVWTALGAPAIALTGGLITSYTLTDPYSGELITSGNLVCRTAMTNLRDVQNARVRYSSKTPLCTAPF